MNQNKTTENITDIDCKYTMNAKVKIIQGFYKGFMAKIIGVTKIKDRIEYSVIIRVNDKDITMQISEDNLTDKYWHIPLLD